MLKKSVTAILIVSALIAVTCGNLFAAIPAAEREALIALYNSTDGPNWYDNTNWLGSPGTECRWYGVTCDEGNTHVTRIDDMGDFFFGIGNNLAGSIPPELGNLSNLQRLDLRYNELTGSIPPELGKLTNLTNLYLYENQLTGHIPPELGNLSALEVLRLDQNQLTGIIPPELGKLTNLIALDLFENKLTGSIPPELGNLSALTWLNLRTNQLTGSIPPELGNLVNLTNLNLRTNQLTGSIPPELGNLINLTTLYLSYNQLTGAIPGKLINLKKLEDGKSAFHRNSLYTSDADLRAFLNSKQSGGDWESYQILNGGYKASSDLWIRAVIRTVEKGSVNAVWQKGGEGSTSGGDRVIWGYFYASPVDVAWGSVQNPDLFVKIWFDRSGRVDVNFFHVSVPEIEVYSDYPYNGNPDEQGLATMSKRYIRHYYENGRSGVSEQYEDGLPASGYLPANLPSGVMTVNNLKFGSVINTLEKGSIEAVWQLGGQDTTPRGDQVVWGYFYANPSDVTWGDKANPDLFVKIWYDVSGRIDVNFFHVSVPDIEVYSDCAVNKVYDNKGTAILNDRYIRHEYYGMCSPDTDPANPPPSADFSFDKSSGDAPLEVIFSDRSSGAIISWSWDFGDGEIPSNRMNPSPVHTYMNAGTYTVKLTVTGAGGERYKTETITVTNPREIGSGH